ncbi:tRNA (adenosine(37)-N6)-threonylcarbamoyltransferase complex transferase subunit TsaD [Pseudogemmatithrix spongiicola]|uniref:tRNA N6-adenosine threonylcarbamoyltransferase n=1 Tax=Pseudogemmatithrix spongiicola TaxID=3062599 RepID=A0AA49JY35_9BACT|nr:tRNA (adenosine(37)-N6)-threonylcarbamoyltransferase complex transferase subunit TsaD [Gemmatimonadaceae bacterium 'strain 138']WKW14091.1 tRNA (adenosine(37)-N6)-threonylcarbamoyltransferase complex transferase subunit TsaD [Gemmatimonadaceae bacterium 'strain 318']
MRLLALETSCDETSAAVLSGTSAAPALESLVILSQDVHTVFGGVVPEIASREHLTAVVPVVERALADAKVSLADIDAIAVTHAPGLVGALLVGVSYAKALATAAGKPVIGVHHMEGHLFATVLEHADATPPFTALLVSGGHTLLLDVEAWGSYRLLGRTRDDAAGEAFDKAAKLLGLPYPGGRHLEQLARSGDPKRHRFTKPMLNAGQKPGDVDYYDVSFSGLKTAVLLATQQAVDLEAEKPHIARGFQDALIGTLVAKTIRAAKAHGRTKIVLGGGVACNGALVDAMRAEGKKIGAEVFAPTPRLATDNAAMIGAAALFRLERGERSEATLNAHSAMPIPGMTTAS